MARSIPSPRSDCFARLLSAGSSALDDREILQVAAGLTEGKEAAEGFLAEYQVLTFGERNAAYVEGKAWHVRLRLEPFFGRAPLHRMTAGRIQAYRVSRMSPPEGDAAKDWRPPAKSTLHQELVTLRQILKWANRQGWIHALPYMSALHRQSGEVSHGAWFSPEEYKRLYEATRERARAPKMARWRGKAFASPAIKRGASHVAIS